MKNIGPFRWFRSAMGSRLARRQVRWVLLAALVLGFLLSTVQIYWEYTARRTRLEQDLGYLLHSVRDSAATAAYQLSADLARAVCDGLVAHPNLQGCRLVLDNDYTPALHKFGYATAV